MSELPEVRTWPSAKDVTPGRIIVGYDGSDHARAAVRWAARHARQGGRSLAVVCVVDVTTRVLPPPEGHVAHWSDMAFDYAQALAQEGVVLARNAASDVPATAVVGSGSPARVLVQVSHGAGHVVVGTRGRGDFAGLHLGSVSSAVMKHAVCSTVIVRGAHPNVPGPDHDVVVGIDGSTSSWWALEAAADVAAKNGARLRVVTAWMRSPVDWSLLAFPAPAWNGVRMMAETAVEAARRAAAIAGRWAADRHPGLEVNEVVVEGKPVGVLAEQSLGAGLLLVGNRGLGPAGSIVLGSVSHGVVHSAPCPVQVVRCVTGIRVDQGC
jgi:nucleotide-binding universal stress UspA family protein